MTQQKDNEIKNLFSSAIKYHKNNNFEKAKDFYNKVLMINANHFETLFLLGSLSAQTNNFNN